MTMLPDHNAVEMTIIPRASDIGGFEVLRALRVSRQAHGRAVYLLG